MSNETGSSGSSESKRTFIELLQEGAWGPTLRLEEDTHDVVELLPAVHRLLVFDAALLEENVDDAGIGDVPVLLEVLADTVPDICGGDVERIEGDNLRSLPNEEQGQGVGIMRTDGFYVSQQVEEHGQEDVPHGTSRGTA